MIKIKYTHIILISGLILSVIVTAAVVFPIISPYNQETQPDAQDKTAVNAAGETYIKWVDFKVTSEAMSDALKIDIESRDSDIQISWIDLLAYLGAKYGGDFSSYSKKHMTELAEKIKSGKTADELASDIKYYSYYKEAYGAVLSGMTGEFYKNGDKKYGLTAFSPISAGYYYNDYDDFGASRSYGYKRDHLGHDMLGSVGTPIIAVESGYVEAVGWNQYGGWRIGIRSFDGKRYYYYAHLRKNHPYNDMYEGKIVTAGSVIGYLGMTGYSPKENTNNINVPHLHFGIQLIFDQSQKDGYNQIWIDVYEITKFLNQNRMPVFRDSGSGEYFAASPIEIYTIPD